MRFFWDNSALIVPAGVAGLAFRQEGSTACRGPLSTVKRRSDLDPLRKFAARGTKADQEHLEGLSMKNRLAVILAVAGLALVLVAAVLGFADSPALYGGVVGLLGWLVFFAGLVTERRARRGGR